MVLKYKKGEMFMQRSNYEAIPHGSPDFRIAVFSEKKYEAPLHHHAEYAIFYLAAGKMKFGIAGDDYIINAGDIMFIEPNTPYYALRTDEGDSFHYYAVVFHAELLGSKDDPCRRFLEESHINRSLELSGELITRIDKMHQWCSYEHFENGLLIKSGLLDILSYIASTRQYVRISSIDRHGSGNASEAVGLVIKYIEEHYREQISRETILGLIPYSKSHLLRIFKAQTGMNIIDYLNKFRIEKACLELIYSDKTVTETALDNGFNTVQYFTRLFSRIMGCTPGKYRRLSRSGTNVPSG